MSVSAASSRSPVLNSLARNISAPSKSTLALLGAGVLSYWTGYTGAWLTAGAGALLLGSKAVSFMNAPLYTLPPESPHVTFDNLEGELVSLYNDLVQTGLDSGNRNLAIQRYNRLQAVFAVASDAQKMGSVSSLLQHIHDIIVTPNEKPTIATLPFAIDRLYEELAQTLDYRTLTPRYAAILRLEKYLSPTDPGVEKLRTIREVFTALMSPSGAIPPNEKLYAFKVKRLLNEIKQNGAFFFNHATLLETYGRRVQDFTRLDKQPSLVITGRAEAVKDLKEAFILLGGKVPVPPQVAAATAQAPQVAAPPVQQPLPLRMPAQPRAVAPPVQQPLPTPAGNFSPALEALVQGLIKSPGASVEEREWQLRPSAQIARKIQKQNKEARQQGIDQDMPRQEFLKRLASGPAFARDWDKRMAMGRAKGAGFAFIMGNVQQYFAAKDNQWRCGAFKPEATKLIEVGGYSVGIAHNIGRRGEQEDRDIALSFDIQIAGRTYPIQIFGIFDGHGGDQVADFIVANLQSCLTNTLKMFNSDMLTDAGIWNALKITFVSLADNYRKLCMRLTALKDPKAPKYLNAGAAVTFNMILDGKLWCANVGDSRSILNRNGQGLQISKDAKPDDPDFTRGVVNRDGVVVGNRVGGALAMARAIGDIDVTGVSARPKITMHKLSDLPVGTDLIITCDGIYDVTTSCAVAEGVQKLKMKGKKPNAIAEDIVKAAFADGSTDNLSAMVVRLK